MAPPTSLEPRDLWIAGLHPDAAQHATATIGILEHHFPSAHAEITAISASSTSPDIAVGKSQSVAAQYAHLDEAGSSLANLPAYIFPAYWAGPDASITGFSIRRTDDGSRSVASVHSTGQIGHEQWHAQDPFRDPRIRKLAEAAASDVLGVRINTELLRTSPPGSKLRKLISTRVSEYAASSAHSLLELGTDGDPLDELFAEIYSEIVSEPEPRLVAVELRPLVFDIAHRDSPISQQRRIQQRRDGLEVLSTDPKLSKACENIEALTGRDPRRLSPRERDLVIDGGWNALAREHGNDLNARWPSDATTSVMTPTGQVARLSIADEYSQPNRDWAMATAAARFGTEVWNGPSVDEIVEKYQPLMAAQTKENPYPGYQPGQRSPAVALQAGQHTYEFHVTDPPSRVASQPTRQPITAATREDRPSGAPREDPPAQPRLIVHRARGSERAPRGPSKERGPRPGRHAGGGGTAVPAPEPARGVARVDLSRPSFPAPAPPVRDPDVRRADVRESRPLTGHELKSAPIPPGPRRPRTPPGHQTGAKVAPAAPAANDATASPTAPAGPTVQAAAPRPAPPRALLGPGRELDQRDVPPPASQDDASAARQPTEIAHEPKVVVKPAKPEIPGRDQLLPPSGRPVR